MQSATKAMAVCSATAVKFPDWQRRATLKK
jgi:hypothetical protein